MNNHVNNITSNKSKIKIVHQNIQGILSKFEFLEIFIELEKPEIICLSEHFLRDFEMNNFLIPDFKLAASYCRKRFKNGGCCIFVRQWIKCDIMDINEFCSDKHSEICGIKLKSLDEEILIFTVYRAPSGDIDTFLASVYSILEKYILKKRKYWY